MTIKFQTNQAGNGASAMQRRSRAGVVIPMFAILLPVMLIFAAMAINIAYIQRSQTELDIATDSAARAASRIYSSTRDADLALEAAVEAARSNPVAGEPLDIAMSDLEWGVSSRHDVNQRYDFTPATAGANAVRLVGDRSENSPQGPVSLFMSSFLNSSQISLESQTVSTRVEVDIALVFDRSGSMAYAYDEPAVYPPAPAAAPAGWDFGQAVPMPSRWLDAVDATELFITAIENTVQQEYVSLCTYADSATIDEFPTENYQRLRWALNHYSDVMSGGGTNIADGIQKGAESLHDDYGGRSFAAKVIIILTDGQVTVGGNPVKKARNVAKDGIMIYTVTFSSEADQDLMKRVAEAGHGNHFHAETREELVTVFETIGRELPIVIVR